ncbi:hypothetical protein KBC77_00075 [Candidatus Saccharibacteria bacterium]|nr:hypothetical protein [Candidatus Saccharibacteria bacterium]
MSTYSSFEIAPTVYEERHLSVNAQGQLCGEVLTAVGMSDELIAQTKISIGLAVPSLGEDLAHTHTVLEGVRIGFGKDHSPALGLGLDHALKGVDAQSAQDRQAALEVASTTASQSLAKGLVLLGTVASRAEELSVPRDSKAHYYEGKNQALLSTANTMASGRIPDSSVAISAIVMFLRAYYGSLTEPRGDKLDLNYYLKRARTIVDDIEHEPDHFKLVAITDATN